MCQFISDLNRDNIMSMAVFFLLLTLLEKIRCSLKLNPNTELPKYFEMLCW